MVRDPEGLPCACNLGTIGEKWKTEAHGGVERFNAVGTHARPVQRGDRRDGMTDSTFYIDCEFDGHGGPLLSIAMVREDGWSLHVSTGAVAEDPWVIANVLPWMNCHEADNDRRVRPRQVGSVLRDFIGDCSHPTIIADSPVDIGRFCEAISTGPDGGWASTGYLGMTFKVMNVDCYPTPLKGAIQHNAWWDAMALRAAARPTAPDEDARCGGTHGGER